MKKFNVVFLIIVMAVTMVFSVSTTTASAATTVTTELELRKAVGIGGDIIIDDTLPISVVLGTINITVDGTKISGGTLHTSGGAYLFNVTGENVEISDTIIIKQDQVNQNIILVNADNFKMTGTEIYGQWNIGDNETVRGLEVAVGGITGLNITKNYFHNLRQPAYINSDAQGVVMNNITEDTKGWVVEWVSNVTFSKNSWGTGNVVDIAPIPNNPITYPNNYSETEAMCEALSKNNNRAIIQCPVDPNHIGYPHSHSTGGNYQAPAPVGFVINPQTGEKVNYTWLYVLIGTVLALGITITLKKTVFNKK